MTRQINRRFGFTLAEMMVVMLILAVVLAAFAPLMTKRRSSVAASGTPWRWANNNVDAFFGSGGGTAMIGQSTRDSNDKARLIINTTGDQRHISFRRSGEQVADMWFNGTSFLFGSVFSDAHSGEYNTAFGFGALESNTSGRNNVAFGYQALSGNTEGEDNIAIGYDALIRNTTGSGNIAIGHSAFTTEEHTFDVTGSNNIAIGVSALAQNVQGENNIAIGSNALSNAGITTTTTQTDLGFCEIKYSCSTDAATNSAPNFNADNYTTAACSAKMIELEETEYAIENGCILNKTWTRYDDSTKIQNPTTPSNNIAIGNNAGDSIVGGSNNIAIGNNACQGISGSNKICVGQDSGPYSPTSADIKYSTLRTGNDNIIFLGDSNTTVSIQGNLVVNGLVLAGDIASDHCHVSGECNNTFRYVSVGGDTISTTGIIGKLNDDLDINMVLYETARYNGLKTSDRRLKNVKGENTAGLEKIRELKVFDFTFKKDSTKTPRVGVMAQDLQKVFPNAVIKGEDGYLQIRMEDMFYALVNAVKQLDKIIQARISEVKLAIIEMNYYKKEIKTLKQENAELKKRLEKLEKAVF